ncbi:MAG: SpoIIE family protein phosphatase [Pseudoruegeria sp.]
MNARVRTDTQHKNIPLQEQAIKKVLVVDDSYAQRRLLTAVLTRWGFSPVTAASGDEALELCKQTEMDLVISDWVMPGMDGLEFCKAFRLLERDSYGYFILLTSKAEKEEIAHGLDVGADDFLTKPVNTDELRARINAAERILRMQRTLSAQKIVLQDKMEELERLYDRLEGDLLEARKLQQSLVRDRFQDIGNATISLLLEPSGHVGGDLVGWFPINDDSFGIYAIDVSGHGVPSALMTARLAGLLSSSSPEHNVAMSRDKDGEYTPRSPAEAMADLNNLTLESLDTDLYFTALLGHYQVSTGIVVLAQAGHPHPAVQRADSSVEFIEEDGFPVGLIPGATYNEFSFKLNPGDRLLMLSDGVTEAEDQEGVMLGEPRLAKILETEQQKTGESLLQSMMTGVVEYTKTKVFSDDVSAVLLERSRPVET